MVELTRRSLLGGLGAVGPARALAALPYRSGGVGYVTPQAFGAIAGDPRAGEANVRAFNAMAAHALASGLEILIPRGIWYLLANGGGRSGWDLRPNARQPCVIRGEGPQSLIRRAPSDRATKFAALIRLWVARGGESFDLEGFAVDGNEAAFPYDPDDPWAYQQSHSIELAAASPQPAAASMGARDLWLSGIVADGIKVGAQCDYFEALRVNAEGRVRRHRSDIQFSRLPKLAVVSDCTLDAFEAEPSKMVEGARMRLKNLVARAAFDLAGPEDDAGGRLQVIAENCQGGMQRRSNSPVTSTNFYRLAGTFSNCAFATSPARRPAHANAIRASTIRFDNSVFAIGPALADPAESASLFAHFERTADSITFSGCRFQAGEGISHGAYVRVGGVSPGSLLRFEDCVTSTPLDYVAQLNQPARVELSGGSLRARKALVFLAPGRAARSRPSFGRGNDWSAPQRVLIGGR